MAVFLSTDDGEILLLDLTQRSSSLVGDLGMDLTDLAIGADGTLYGVDDQLVYQLQFGRAPADQTRLGFVPQGGIVGLDLDAQGRLLLGLEDGRLLRLDGTDLSEIGQFADGIQGGIARIGDLVFTATGAGALSAMSLSNGEATGLYLHGLGTVNSLSADGALVRLSASNAGSSPQFFLFDPAALTLTHEAGLLGFFERPTGTASGALGEVTLAGGGGDDQILGTLFGDLISAADGDDRVYARGGHDTLLGGLGDDFLNGQEGKDVLAGGAGDDLILGGGGRDWASFEGAGARVDLAMGGVQDTGHGLDQLQNIENLRGSIFSDTLKGDSANNVLEGGDGHDFLNGRTGKDTLRGGEGDDTLRPGLGNDVILGEAGFDQVDYSDAPGALTLSLAVTQAQATGASDWDRLRGIEGLVGSGFGDGITGSQAANWLLGGAGDDTIRGGAGADTLKGQSGDDLLRGGAGLDSLSGGAGDDTLEGGRDGAVTWAEGGAGADQFDFALTRSGGGANGQLRLVDFDAAEGDGIRLYGATSAGDFLWVAEAAGQGYTRVTFGNGAELLLAGTAPGDVSASWFL